MKHYCTILAASTYSSSLITLSIFNSADSKLTHASAPSGFQGEQPVASAPIIEPQTPREAKNKTHLSISSKATNMLSPYSDSSPLSSPPSSPLSAHGLPSLNGFLLSQRTVERNDVPLTEDTPTIDAVVSAPGSRTGSPTPSTAETTAILISQSPKRALEEVEEHGEINPPTKKRKYQSKAAGRKTKGAADQKATAELATTEVSEKPASGKAPRKKITPVSVTQSTRPTRNRKAPDRFENTEEQATPKATPRRGPSKVFDPVFITRNSTSRLGKADVYVRNKYHTLLFLTHLSQHMLLEDLAWTSLTTEQQSTLLGMLPQNELNQALIERVIAGENGVSRPQAFTISNDCFRTDVAKFKEDLKSGHLAKTWQTAAEQAVSERANGEYDDWKAQEAEQWWGQKSKDGEV